MQKQPFLNYFVMLDTEKVALNFWKTALFCEHF